MVVASAEMLIFSVEPDLVLVKGYKTRNEVFGLVIRPARRSEACRMLLLFVDNLLVKRVAELMRVYH